MECGKVFKILAVDSKTLYDVGVMRSDGGESQNAALLSAKAQAQEQAPRGNVFDQSGAPAPVTEQGQALSNNSNLLARNRPNSSASVFSISGAPAQVTPNGQALPDVSGQATGSAAPTDASGALAPKKPTLNTIPEGNSNSNSNSKSNSKSKSNSNSNSNSNANSNAKSSSNSNTNSKSNSNSKSNTSSKSNPKSNSNSNTNSNTNSKSNSNAGASSNSTGIVVPPKRQTATAATDASSNSTGIVVSPKRQIETAASAVAASAASAASDAFAAVTSAARRKLSTVAGRTRLAEAVAQKMQKGGTRKNRKIHKRSTYKR